MKNIGGAVFVATLLGTLALSSRLGLAQAESSCAGLPTYTDLKNAMIIASGPSSGIGDPNRGFHNNMWGTIVNRDGVVCAVVFTGSDRHAEWPGSRVISAQKANSANAFNLAHL